MISAHICLGGNHPRTESEIVRAVRFISTLGHIDADSQCFRSEAEWSPKGTPLYLNRLIIISTALSGQALLNRTKAYEAAIRRLNPAELVVIDIDIVSIDNTVLRPRDYDSKHYRRALALLEQARR